MHLGLIFSDQGGVKNPTSSRPVKDEKTRTFDQPQGFLREPSHRCRDLVVVHKSADKMWCRQETQRKVIAPGGQIDVWVKISHICAHAPTPLSPKIWKRSLLWWNWWYDRLSGHPRQKQPSYFAKFNSSYFIENVTLKRKSTCNCYQTVGYEGLTALLTAVVFLSTTHAATSKKSQSRQKSQRPRRRGCPGRTRWRWVAHTQPVRVG